MLKDVARIQIGPEMRRGIAELDGEGEVTGAIVIMRHGKNALTTIAAVKEKMAHVEGKPANRASRSSRPMIAPG
jgi:Cu(I)/Ag(I) efflux system membrane protein CusA/SilA